MPKKQDIGLCRTPGVQGHRFAFLRKPPPQPPILKNSRGRGVQPAGWELGAGRSTPPPANTSLPGQVGGGPDPLLVQDSTSPPPPHPSPPPPAYHRLQNEGFLITNLDCRGKKKLSFGQNKGQKKSKEIRNYKKKAPGGVVKGLWGQFLTLKIM